MPPCSGHALPRVGLLGNPSDGYGGRVLAFTFADFAARVRVEDSPVLDVAGHRAGSFDDLFADLGSLSGATALLAAGAKRLLDHVGEPMRCRFASQPLRIEMSSDIPRQVGLGGSSAIVIAGLRALCRRWAIDLHPAELAELALAAEVEELGIAAGPQDRVAQAYEGLVYMDFRPPRSALRYRRLAVELLPALFVAWDPRGGSSSGIAHGAVRQRFDGGDAGVHAAMARWPELAEEGVGCLERADVARLARLVDENFDLRASIWDLRERDHEMVAIGRAAGAGVKFCGSGGAVVGVMPDPSDYSAIEAGYRAAGYSIVRPSTGAAAGGAQTA